MTAARFCSDDSNLRACRLRWDCKEEQIDFQGLELAVWSQGKGGCGPLICATSHNRLPPLHIRWEAATLDSDLTGFNHDVTPQISEVVSGTESYSGASGVWDSAPVLLDQVCGVHAGCYRVRSTLAL